VTSIKLAWRGDFQGDRRVPEIIKKQSSSGELFIKVFGISSDKRTQAVFLRTKKGGGKERIF
jgi:hypothetical protein